MLRIAVALMVIFGMSSCMKASFSSDTPKRSAVNNPETSNPRNPAVDISEDGIPGNPNNPFDPNSDDPRPGEGERTQTKLFNLDCENGSDSEATVNFAAPVTTKVEAQVQGKFCPASTRDLTIMFVVDFSGSMGRHKDEGQELSGNDPQINGSCGRLRSAEAILNKVTSSMTSGDNVRVGMIPFASAALNNKMMPIMSIEAFRAQMNKDSFCQYVVQNESYGYDPANPGGIDGRSGLFGMTSVSSSTNYSAAFSKAQNILSGEGNGHKVVYFVSDGEPTSGGNDPVAAGERAGRSLRENVPNLVVNGLLLGHTDPSARNVLEIVTGSADRVRDAENADQLAVQITQFPAPTIDASTGYAEIQTWIWQRHALGLQFLTQATQNIWEYKTQPFVLVGRRGEAVKNRVIISATGPAGEKYEAIVNILYTQE